jgi:hypothetical protein
MDTPQGQPADDYTKRDLAAQERMAEGTEELVRLTDRQNVITAVEAGLLLITIFFTARAAVAASRAAWAAIGTITLAKDYLERAYVFGGCGESGFVTEKGGQRIRERLGRITGKPLRGEDGNLIIWVRATDGNYGKTPAWVESIFVERCIEADLPSRPNYINDTPVNDALPPGIMGRPINNVFREFPATDGQIYYGRIHYRDVFDRPHYSSFIYRFFADGRHEPVGNVHSDYWDYDKGGGEPRKAGKLHTRLLRALGRKHP